jgi:hypothetical protein
MASLLGTLINNKQSETEFYRNSGPDLHMSLTPLFFAQPIQLFIQNTLRKSLAQHFTASTFIQESIAYCLKFFPK